MSITNIPIVLKPDEGITLTKCKVAMKSNKPLLELYNFVKSDANSNIKERDIVLKQGGECLSNDTLISSLVRGSDGNVGLSVCLKAEVPEVPEVPEVVKSVPDSPVRDVEITSVTVVQKNASGLSYYLYSTNTIVEIGYKLDGKDCRIEERYFDTGDCTDFHYRVCNLIQNTQKRGFRGRYTFKPIVLG